MLTYGIIAGLERLCMPVLFKEISVDLNLSLVKMGTIWGADPLAGIFVGLIGGLLADRFGIKRTLTVVCILAGIFSALRGFSVNFITMAGGMFLFGITAAMTPSIVPKTASVWFRRQQLGIINALINVSWSTGAMFATMTSATILSPLLGGWRNVLFVLGIPAVIVGLLWLFTGRDPNKDEIQTTQTNTVPLKQAFLHVIRLREVWVLGLISLTLWGANMGFIGYLPLYLRNNGWSNASADGMITAFNGASMLGMFPMIRIANRLKAHKSMLFFCMVITSAFMALIPLVSNSGIWPLIIIATFLRSAAFAITNVLIVEIPGVGSTYGGTAVGLVTSIGMIGAFASPPIGNSFEQLGSGIPFFFWAAMAACSLPMFLGLRRINDQEPQLAH
jgi:NNP family nitrate/nitrite transporter-like MFS transporter